MDSGKVLAFCWKNGVKLSGSWWHSCQAVRYHNKGETKEHFMYKAEIAHELMRRGQTIFTEFEFSFKVPFGKDTARMLCPVADIFWLDEKMVIELESKPIPFNVELKMEQFKDFNPFVFDISKHSVEYILEKIGAR